jgi:hypothetical membrane protein
MLLTRSAVLGALCWLVAGPLFLAAHVLAALGWHDPRYDWATNGISDLGNVHCGVWDATRPRYVCSPWHGSMNAAVVLTGLLLAAGLALGWRDAVARGAAMRLTQSLVLLATIGYLLAGAFPADVDGYRHVLGALLVLVAGNAGLVVAGFATRGRARAWTWTAASVAVGASVLVLDRQPMGIGVGAVERLAVFPLPVWACCVGTGLLCAHVDALTGGAGRRGRSGVAGRPPDRQDRGRDFATAPAGDRLTAGRGAGRPGHRPAGRVL